MKKFLLIFGWLSFIASCLAYKMFLNRGMINEAVYVSFYAGFIFICLFCYYVSKVDFVYEDNEDYPPPLDDYL